MDYAVNIKQFSLLLFEYIELISFMRAEKKALITGASKGVGRAVAKALAKEGFDLVICARHEADLEKLESELRGIRSDIEVLVYPVDFANPAACQTLVERITRQWPLLDVLINNVGVFAPASILDEAPQLLQQQMQVNLYTAHYLATYFGRRMRDMRRGHIFNITSIASRVPMVAAGSYTVTKYALAGLTQVLREELRPYGVKVSEIIPGSTWTASWEGTDIPPERFVQPEDIAQAITACLNTTGNANVDEVRITPVQPIG